MAIKRGTQVDVESTDPETSNDAGNGNGDAGNGTAKKRGPKPGTKRGPSGPKLRFNDERDMALTETLFDLQGTGVALTIPAIMQALSVHSSFAGDAHLLKETGVKAALDRIRESLGEEDAALLPELETNRKRVVNVQALKDIIAARRAASAA